MSGEEEQASGVCAPAPAARRQAPAQRPQPRARSLIIALRPARRLLTAPRTLSEFPQRRLPAVSGHNGPPPAAKTAPRPNDDGKVNWKRPPIGVILGGTKDTRTPTF